MRIRMMIDIMRRAFRLLKFTNEHPIVKAQSKRTNTETCLEEEDEFLGGGLSVQPGEPRVAVTPGRGATEQVATRDGLRVRHMMMSMFFGLKFK